MRARADILARRPYPTVSAGPLRIAAATLSVRAYTREDGSVSVYGILPGSDRYYGAADYPVTVLSIN